MYCAQLNVTAIYTLRSVFSFLLKIKKKNNRKRKQRPESLQNRWPYLLHPFHGRKKTGKEKRGRRGRETGIGEDGRGGEKKKKEKKFIEM